MDKCIIFLSKEENYLNSAIKIKNESKIETSIEYIEIFLIENKNKIKNCIVYFLCNNDKNKEVIDLFDNSSCYIFNIDFFKNNYTKLQIQKILNDNNIDVPFIYNNNDYNNIDFPVYCKENKHGGIKFEVNNQNIIKDKLKFLKNKRFYIEEKIDFGEENKYYYIKGEIYNKRNEELSSELKKTLNNISHILNLEIYSIDIIKVDKRIIIIDVNSSSGFYALDNARTYFIKVISDKYNELNK